MILYHIITIYHLLNAIVHRAKFHPTETCILILPDFFIQFFSSGQCGELTDNLFFDAIYFFPYAQCNKAAEDEITSKVVEFIENDIPYDISAFNQIYIWGIHFYFSLGLIEKGISFTGAEEAAGAFSKQEICRDAIKTNAFHYNLAEKNGLLDYSNKYINKIICNFSVQRKEMLESEPRLINFSVVDELLLLTSSMQQKILMLFRAPSNIAFTGHQTLLLTQHFMNLDLLTYEEQQEIYLTFADYFLDNTNLIIKPHPSDYMDYNNIFPDCRMLNSSFPIELLPVLCNCEEITLATIYSTGIDNVKNYFKETLSLNMTYRNIYKYTPAFWLSFKIIQSVSEHLSVIGMIGADILLLRTLIWKKCNCEIDLPEIRATDRELPEWIIVDDLEKSFFDRSSFQEFLNETQKNNYIFINSRRDYCYYDYSNKDICQNIVPVRYHNLNRDDEILILCRDYRTLERIRNFSMNETLNYSNGKLKIDAMSETDIKIAILKGTLQATEERLQYYIQLVDDLRNGRKQ